MKFQYIFYILSAVCFCACEKSNTTVDYAANAICNGDSPTYNSNISQIINANCAFSGCHNSGSAKAGVNLEGYANASNQFKNNSKNLTAIHHGSGADPMPKGSSKLDDSTINKLDCWVKNGCPQ